MDFDAQSDKRRDTVKIFAALVAVMLSAIGMVAQARPQNSIAAPAAEPAASYACTYAGDAGGGLNHYNCAICRDFPILGHVCKKFSMIASMNPADPF